MSTYYILNKPFGYLSQFTKEGRYRGLSDLNLFPPNVYAVGRLDADSEGLLILTDDKALNQLLLKPENEHERTYWAQVEGTADDFACNEMERGVLINVSGGYYKTKPCKARLISSPKLPERQIPIRFRKSVPTSWIEIKLIEGKNRQVRKMTAAVGYPTLRLIRVAIENLELGKLPEGEMKEVNKDEIYKLLNLSS